MEIETTIRPARPSDLAGVRALLEEAGLPGEGVEDQFGEAFCVAEAGGELLGAAGVERYGRHGLLRSVVVAAAARGRGVGEGLVRDRLQWAREHGVERMHLLTTTAAGFFPRLGFAPAERASAPEEIRRSREFASVCPASAAFLTLPLAAGDGEAGGSG